MFLYFLLLPCTKSPGEHSGYEYSRAANPTRQALEEALSIENGARGLAFCSGLAAIDCVLKLLNPGDEIIARRFIRRKHTECLQDF